MTFVDVPDSISWLVDEVGEEMALEFIENVAGQRLVIPKKSAKSALEKRYGAEIVQCLVGHLPDSLWDVPMAKDWRARLLARRGLSDNEIAVRCGVAYRSVRRMLTREDRDIRNQIIRMRNQNANCMLSSKDKDIIDEMSGMKKVPL